MLNKYPLWKYIMVLMVLAIGFLYAAPNLYGENPSVQISGTRNAVVDVSTQDKIKAALDENSISFLKMTLEDERILVRFTDTNDQLKAKDIIANTLSDKYITALNLAPAQPEWLKNIGGNPMKLGLDLRGGVHFTMAVDMDAAIDAAKEGMVADFKSDLLGEKIRYSSIKEISGKQGVVVKFRNAEDLENGRKLLKKNYRDLIVEEDGSTDALDVTAVMTEQKLKETKEYALQQNITIIRNRVNEIGVAEPLVQRQGADRIVVQLPGIQDTARAKQILNATATLEFRLADVKTDMRDALNGRVPGSSEIIPRRDNGQPVLVKKRVMLRGDRIVGASSSFDENGRPQVNIKLDAKGGNIMSRFSKDNVGKPMASVFIEYKPTTRVSKDGKPEFKKVVEILNVATIQTRLGRNFRITGLDSPQEAHNLALLLRSGALIAPIQIVEERTVGPSLGQENINKGVQAVVLGFALVLLFMLVYYKKFGLVANLALAANLVLIIGVMSMIPGATLTLPGIAGIVLTVGMAVDANVLIFERIREEIRDGRSPQQAIHHGYDSAFSTIADANITTFIAAVILFAVGTGPIKGFAVTLAIGILTSMFTAIVGTRAVVNAVWGGKSVKEVEKLSI
ncbi:protein translocase subunit SecD [Flocculibacter collagenilyticus]|uniref:protein translocase subunit SecD n=1 Tax=Flocculibacter collagenilyticus TaxID=2744479 RepID=UPI0018F61411|nr:protein translocase subunit SecD [Flocculibacter collagenilyticus]